MFQTCKSSIKGGNFFNCHSENHGIRLAGGFSSVLLVVYCCDLFLHVRTNIHNLQVANQHFSSLALIDNWVAPVRTSGPPLKLSLCLGCKKTQSFPSYELFAVLSYLLTVFYYYYFFRSSNSDLKNSVPSVVFTSEQDFLLPVLSVTLLAKFHWLDQSGSRPVR